MTISQTRVLLWTVITVSAMTLRLALGGEAPAQAIFHAAPTPLPQGAVTNDWPSLLGPTHNQVSSETHLRKEFGAAGPTLVWEIEKGEGYASPAIVGDQLVLFHRVGHEEVIECLNAGNGQRIWRYTYPTTYSDRYGYCNGPRSSPVIAGDSVFAIGAEGLLHCLDLKTGAVRWKHNILTEYKLHQGFFGVGSTPLADGNLLIVNVGARNGPCVVAFDQKTGDIAWKAADKWGPSYASPVPATIHGKHRVLVFAGGESNPPIGGLLCINPADGKVDFTFPWRGDRRESVNASSPVVIGSQIFLSECYGTGGTLLDIDDQFQPHQVWTNTAFGTHFMSAVERDGYLYGVDGHGPNDAYLVCVDLKTGKELWRNQPEWEDTLTTPTGERKIPTGTYRCWLTPVDGHYLVLGEFGHLLWMNLTPKGPQITSRAWLFAAGETWTPPAISRSLLYICQNTRDGAHEKPSRLLCYDLRERKIDK